MIQCHADLGINFWGGKGQKPCNNTMGKSYDQYQGTNSTHVRKIPGKKPKLFRFLWL